MNDSLERAVRTAERRLRAHGMTAHAAFEVLMDALKAHADGEAMPEPLRDLELPTDDHDLLGLAYERFFPDMFKQGAGQYFTPPELARLLLSQLPPLDGVDVLDPTCGSGTLLVSAARQGARVRGIEIDPRLARVAGVHLRLAGIDGTIDRDDFFAREPEPADVLLANPPFSVPIERPEVLDRYPRLRGRRSASSDLVFVHTLPDWVRPGGWAAVLLPWSMVTNPRRAAYRRAIDASFEVRAVLALPEGIFRPFGGAQGRAAMLWLQRHPAPAAPTRWATLDDPGYDTRSKRLRRTQTVELDARSAGRGWHEGDRWTPESPTSNGRRVGQLATSPSGTSRITGATTVLELSDVDPVTHEAHPREVHAPGRKQSIAAGDVLVARLRPEKRNVTVAPCDGHGSPEWIRLKTTRPHLLFHLLRAPEWHEQLPPTSGQTRPRTDAAAVLGTRVRWPGDAVADRIESVSQRLHAHRRRLAQDLDALQDLVDRHQAGELDADALGDAVADRFGD